MIVGSFGNITFRTSSFDVRTFKNLARKRSYSFSEHEVVFGKPYLQRGHENLETITFEMVLDRGLNPLPVDCRKSRDLLDEMLKTGDAYPLVIGTMCGCIAFFCGIFCPAAAAILHCNFNHEILYKIIIKTLDFFLSFVFLCAK